MHNNEQPTDAEWQEIVGQFIDAAVENHELAETLLKQYPRLREARWILGESVLHFLAIEDYPVGVKWLLERAFDPNTVNELGATPLIEVLVTGNLDMARLLIAHGADLSVSSPVFDDLFEAAQASGQPEVISFVENLLQEHDRRLR